MIDADERIDNDMLQEYAQSDAREELREEQIEHWYCDVDERQTFTPKHAWLKNWIDREPTDDEFKIYAHEYNRAMKRALSVVNKLYNSEAPEDEYMEHIDDVMERAVEAAGEGVKA